MLFNEWGAGFRLNLNQLVKGSSIYDIAVVSLANKPRFLVPVGKAL